MLSGLGFKLTSVLTANALRLSALVAAAVSAGYLWRSAVDFSAPEQVLVAVAPAVPAPLPASPFSSLSTLHPLRGQHAVPVERRRSAARSHAKQGRGTHTGGARAEAVSFVSRPPTTAPAAPTPRPPAWRVNPKPKSPHKGRPKPPPPPPPPLPRPNPPPPPPPPAGPPPAPPPAPPPPPPPPVGVDTRPGNGKGDKNHVHTGPPGQQKDKSKKK
jgi:hypothetical protein